MILEDETQYIRISKGTIELRVRLFNWKNDGSFIAYLPAINVMGYGDTLEEAKETLKIIIDDFCESIMSLSAKERDKALFELGWHKEKLKRKNYSQAHVDKEGMLRDFEIEKDTAIQEETLEMSV